MFPDIYAVYFTCAKLCLDFPFVSFAIALGMKERKTKKTRWKLRQMQKKKLKAARKSSKMSVGGGNNPENADLLSYLDKKKGLKFNKSHTTPLINYVRDWWVACKH